MSKAFEELQIKDDFMFSVIMRNPKFCKPFLERVLGVKISRIEYPRSQETIDLSAEAKSVRLDYSDKIIIPTFKSINLNQPIIAHCSV